MTPTTTTTTKTTKKAKKTTGTAKARTQDKNGYPILGDNDYDEMNAFLQSGEFLPFRTGEEEEGAEEAEFDLESHTKTLIDLIDTGDENSLLEAKQVLDQWTQVLSEREESLSMKDAEELSEEELKDHQFVLGWKLFVGKQYTTVLYRLTEYSKVLSYSDKVLAMEPVLERYIDQDDIFFDLNDVCSLRVEALMSLNRLDKALLYINFLIDERLRNKLEEIRMDESIYESEREKLLDTVNEQLRSELATRANIHYLKNRKEMALKDLNEILRDGNHPSLELRALIYMERGKIANAMKDAEQLLSMDVEDEVREKAQLIYAICLSKEERYEEALEAFNKCTENEMATPGVYLMRSTCYYQVRNFEKALEDIKMVESLSPEHMPDVIKEHINCLLYLARYDELEEFCNRMPSLLRRMKISQQEKNDLQLLRHLLISSCKRWNGDYEGALDYYRKNAEPHMKSGSSDLLVSMYDLELRILTDWGKDFQLALKVANTYVEATNNSKSYENIEALMMRAVVLANLGQFIAATNDLALVEKTLRETTDNSFIVDELNFQLKYAMARVFAVDEKKHTQALQLLKEAIETGKQLNIRGSTVFALADLAKLESKLGLKEEANQHMREVLEHVPNHKVFSKHTL